MFLVASLTPQLAQFVRRSWIVFPQPRQRLSRRGALIDAGSGGAPFASRLLRCVRRVAINCRVSLLLVGLDVEDQISCATYSATGATSLRHVSEVSQSVITNDE